MHRSTVRCPYLRKKIIILFNLYCYTSIGRVDMKNEGSRAKKSQLKLLYV